MSPTVLRVGPFAVGFFPADGSEPPHVHVRAGGGAAKFWLGPPVRLARRPTRMSAQLARDAEFVVTEHRAVLMEAWHDYFGA